MSHRKECARCDNGENTQMTARLTAAFATAMINGSGKYRLCMDDGPLPYEKVR